MARCGDPLLEDTLASIFVNKEELRAFLEKSTQEQLEELKLEQKAYALRKWTRTHRRVLVNSQIVCCTLSRSGSDLMANTFKDEVFEYLIVDEACQSVEPSCLIPF